MNTQEIKEHAERLLAAAARVEAVEAQIKNIAAMPYYELFGSEQERSDDISETEGLRGRMIETLRGELRIGQLLAEGV